MIPHQPYPYTGIEKSLVIGIDVGTTLSGVSYALLEPGKVPRIQPVMRFSGQRKENGKSKVRSVVCYDQHGKFITVDPETDPEVNPTLSEIGVRRAECFKLHLWPNPLAADKRPHLEKLWPLTAPTEEDGESEFSLDTKQGKAEGSRGIRDRSKDEDLLSIPSREVVERQPMNKKKVPRPVTDDFKTSVQVYTDFLQYLFKSAKEYITETERNLNPSFKWSAIETNAHFVLTLPNGWEEKQQAQMREAAVAAGLVDKSTAADRITFVTEGEASLHFCLDKNPELRQERGGLLVVDCGSGTIDLSAYSQTGKDHYKQIVSPYCLRQGSIFVTSRARDYFQGKFKDSIFGSDDVIETMARAFDKPEGVKCMFRCSDRPYFVKFGGLRDNDKKYGVSGGKFKVEGTQMAQFFEPAIQGIIGGIENQCRNTEDGISIKYVLLVGGFGRSQYLYQKLSDHFNSSGIVILRPDITHPNKAAADGAVSWYLERYASNYSYSVMVPHLLDSDQLNPESATHTTTNTTGNRGQAACTKQAFTFRRTRPSSQQVHICNNGQKLPDTTQATNWRRERTTTAGRNWLARTRVNHWPERGDTGENGRIRTGDRKQSDGHRATTDKDHHNSAKGEQLRKLAPSIGKSDMSFVVKELVRMLNTQIEQTSSQKTDSLSYRESPISSKELEDALSELTDYIESSLFSDFRSKSNNLDIGPDPLITQIAPQSRLAKVCIYIINNGIPPSDSATPPRTYGDMTN